MAWYDEAIFYHIYPLGMTNAEKENSYSLPKHRLNSLIPWIDHIKSCGFNALYIGPLFESVGHGYETTDYKKLDSRLGTNDDLKQFVSICHEKGIRVVLDGVFNHTGRDFFAFRDLLANRENSPYKDWYCNVNFFGNNEYNDNLSYDNWGGYNLLVKLNQKNPAVRDYICDVIRFWVSEFDIDGIRLDAADVLDFDFMKALRILSDTVKPDFWLMGEVIHGDYSRWVNDSTLHSVTNYQLHKALYSAHNDHNYFEIAHTVKRLNDMLQSKIKLYNFTDNHDVERIYTKLSDKNNFVPVHILLYTLPGIPSVYYGSEFAIEGKKEKFSDASLRPFIPIDEYIEKSKTSPFVSLISRLGKIKASTPAFSYGNYTEVLLTNTAFVFSRNFMGKTVFVAVNNSSNEQTLTFSAPVGDYSGSLFGATHHSDGSLCVTIAANSGEIFIPDFTFESDYQALPSIKISAPEPPASNPSNSKSQENLPVRVPANTPYEEMSIEQLQQAILDKMAQNGPVTDQMKKDVYENVYHNSLVNWIKSFR